MQEIEGGRTQILTDGKVRRRETILAKTEVFYIRVLLQSTKVFPLKNYAKRLPGERKFSTPYSVRTREDMKKIVTIILIRSPGQNKFWLKLSFIQV